MDEKQIAELIAALNRLAAAIEQMPRSITIYDANYRPPGGYGMTINGANGGG